jgi:hypothetical protein
MAGSSPAMTMILSASPLRRRELPQHVVRHLEVRIDVLDIIIVIEAAPQPSVSILIEAR